jgi:diaminopimelate decarboxylase
MTDNTKADFPTVDLDYKTMNALTEIYGDAFYVLHVEQFKKNYLELKQAFSSIYPQFNIAYSYKTNYIPRLAQAVDTLGGFAEVVSDMEMNIAFAAGVKPEKIIFNGPYKKVSAVEYLLLAGGTINIDSVYELDSIKQIHLKHPKAVLNLGIRVNFAINDGILSRFGIDVESEDFRVVLNYITATPNLHFMGLHAHFATRSLDTWKPRAVGMLNLINSFGIYPERIDLGGGLFGKMADELRNQFETDIPAYADYAREVAAVFAEYYKSTPIERQPLLLIEPGSALVGDCMSLVSRVQNIKTVRDKPIATLLASMYNINMGKKNPPLRVVENLDIKHRAYNDLDFAGFTCIESDYLYRNYNGSVAVGDFVVIDNVGSYSIVFKPPFILPNFAVIGFRKDGSVDQIKRPETFDDLFQTYYF